MGNNVSSGTPLTITGGRFYYSKAVYLWCTNVCQHYSGCNTLNLSHVMDLMGVITSINKAIRDGRPRPPRHQCVYQISSWSVEKWLNYDVGYMVTAKNGIYRNFIWGVRNYEIWPNNVFNLSATYDLDLWPKILKIFLSHGVPIRNMYAKFHNDRLRNGWDITLWNFAKTRTNKHTDRQTDRHGHYNTSPSPYGGRGNYIWWTTREVLWQLIWFWRSLFYLLTIPVPCVIIMVIIWYCCVLSNSITGAQHNHYLMSIIIVILYLGRNLLWLLY